MLHIKLKLRFSSFQQVLFYPDMTTEQRKQQARFNDIRALSTTFLHGLFTCDLLMMMMKEMQQSQMNALKKSL